MISLIRDLIGIQPIPDPDKSPGGIIIPDMAKERSDQGIIKYVGPKVKDCKIGDYVLFSGYDGTTIQLENEADGTIIVMRETSIKCKLLSPDTDIRGLYFKAQSTQQDEEILKDFIAQIISKEGLKFDSDIDEDVFLSKLIASVRIHDQYFTATYEMAMNLIADNFKDTDFAKNTGFNNPLAARPSKEDYDEDENFEEE